MANIKTRRSENTETRAFRRERGRPREFDRESALQSAMHLFWQQGYEPTTMADLRSVLGLTQASIYAAFGSKEQLFREAVELYQQTAGISTARALKDKPTARASIYAMLCEAVVLFTSSGNPAGCLIVLGTMNCSRGSRRVQDHLLSLRLKTPNTILKRLKKGQMDGDVPDTAPVHQLTAYYTTLLHGLSIQARDGATLKTLMHVVECSMTSWDVLTSNADRNT